MAGTRPVTVLVVEDEDLLRWSIAELLRRRGHAVIECATAAAAREAMDRISGRVEVVLLDYRLPDSNDVGLLDEVRRRCPRSSVVLMTPCGTADAVQRAMARGAFCVLSKPVDMNHIEAVVADASRSSRRH